MGVSRCKLGHRWSSDRDSLNRRILSASDIADVELAEPCPICTRRNGKDGIDPGDTRCYWCARATLKLIYFWGDRVCSECARGDFEGCSAWIGKNGPVVVRGT